MLIAKLKPSLHVFCIGKMQLFIFFYAIWTAHFVLLAIAMGNSGIKVWHISFFNLEIALLSIKSN